MAKIEFDPMVRPQDNFFQHVNGRWLTKHPIPSHRRSWGAVEELQDTTFYRIRDLATKSTPKKIFKSGSVEQKVRDFYASGMSSPRQIEQSGLSAINEWLTKVDQAANKVQLSKLLAELHLIGVNVLFDVQIEPDYKAPKKYILRIHQAGLSLPNRDYYLLSKPPMPALRKAFVGHLKMMTTFVEFANPKLASSLLSFETVLAKASDTVVQERDIARQYNKIKLGKLDQLMPEIDWPTYFSALGVSSPGYLIVDQPGFMRAVSRLLNRTELEGYRAYLKWQLLLASTSYMGDRIAQANFEYFGKKLQGRQRMPPRWQRVVIALVDEMGDAIGKLYQAKYFPPVAKTRMEQMAANLKIAFNRRIEELTWMDDKTKTLAKRKLAKMIIKTGGPAKPLNFRTTKINPKSYLSNVYQARWARASHELGKLTKPVDRYEWWMTAAMVNAGYTPTKNDMIFPAAFLQPPFFDPKADDATNYGAIGYIIGHEMTHGFDDQGSQFDDNGETRPWWSQNVRQHFKKLTMPMVRLTDRYEALPGLFLQGKLSLGENIADLGGAEIALDALQLSLKRNHADPDTLQAATKAFFISLAWQDRRKFRPEFMRQAVLSDEHAPHEFRVNNTVRNMDRFYEVFGVEPSDKMYLPPKGRVRIW